MTIVYTQTDPSSGSAVSLAGAEDDRADGPRDLDVGSSALVQTEPIVRAAYPARFARGNRTFSVTFTARKKHADYEAAMAYVITHTAAFNGLGNVVFTQGSAVLTLAKCNVTARGHTLGATTEWQYTIEGIKTS